MSKRTNLEGIRSALKQGKEVMLWARGEYGGIMMRATGVSESGVIDTDFEGECPPHPEMN